MVSYEHVIFFDRYRADEKLGDSPVFVSYIGTDTSNGSRVLIKILNPDMYTRYEVDRICFSGEIGGICRFDDPHILKIYAADSYINTLVIVSEYLPCISLKEYLEKHGKLDIKEALGFTYQIASALKYAHGRQIVHRNIKPVNICVTGEEGEPTLKLFDFGMSYVIDYMSSSKVNANDDFGYMSPEATGLLDRKVDARSDLYSVGILLYLFVTGTLPFHADSIDNMVYKHVAVTPPSPDKFNPDIPADISKMILKLLSKDPDMRYQSANDLLADIDRFSNNSYSAEIAPAKDLLRSIGARSKQLSRKKELAKIRTLLDEALSSKGNFCTVQGPFGYGKSDLVTIFANELVTNAVPYFRAHFTATTAQTPYHAFREILINYIELYDRNERKVQVTERNRLARALSGFSDLIISICPEMKRILPASLTLPSIGQYKESQRSNMLLASFFLSLYTLEKPFVLILEDLQYADAASLRLIEEIASTVSNYKVFVLCTYRSSAPGEFPYLDEFVKNISANSTYEDIRLTPFDEPRMKEFISDILDIRPDLCSELSSYLLEKTEGNPYFAVNVLRSMLEDGVIRLSRNTLEANWGLLRAINTVDHLSRLIDKRMEQLSEDAISFLEIAAIIGSDFSLDLLCLVTDVDRTAAMSWIDAGIAVQFIEFKSSHNLMSFAHDDIYQKFLSRITPERAKELHYWIGRAIEFTLTGEDKNNIFIMLRHLLAAEDEELVYKYILEAARLSKESNAIESSLEYYTIALDLIEKHEGAGSETWLSIKLTLAELSLTAGRFDSAISIACELLPVMDDPVSRAKLQYYIGLSYFRQSNFVECENSLISALSELGDRFPTGKFNFNMHRRLLQIKKKLTSHFTNDPSIRSSENDNARNRIIVSIYETLCWIYIYTDFTKFEYSSLYLYQFAYSNYGSSPQMASAASSLSVYYMTHGKFKAAEYTQNLAIKMRKSSGDDYGMARSHFFTGIGYQWQSDLEKSAKAFNEAIQGFLRVGDLWEVNNSNNFLARTFLMGGKYDDCIKLCEEIISSSSKLGDRVALAQAYATLTTCYTEQGNFIVAGEIARRFQTLTSTLNFPYVSLIYNLCYGKLLLEQDKLRDAVSVLSEGVKIYETHNLTKEYTASIYGYFAIAKIRLLNSERSTLPVSHIQSIELNIADLCDKAAKESKLRPNEHFAAIRANALFGIITERYGRTESFYKAGTALSVKSQYRYEVAKLDYEFGCYLLAKHRLNESRYYIFEAYMSFSGISSNYYLKKCESIISERFKDDFKNNPLLETITDRRNRMNIDRKINTLLRLGDRLTSTLELEELQRKILQDAVELVGAERGILFLYPESGEKKLYVASVFNLGNFDCNTYDWMLEEVERKGKPIVINDVQSDEYRKHYTVMVRYGIKSVMAMPIFVRGNLFGVIYLDSRLLRQIFTDDYIETMEFIANQSGAPIENARLYHRAITDGLTQIYGRSYLDNQIIDRTADPNVKLAAIMMDVDNFKRCNDTYGHAFGDKVLKQLAGIMKRVSGEHGTPCRYGGEEFVVLIDSNDEALVLSIAEKIRSTVESSAVPLNDGNDVKMINVTISVGVSIWNNTLERVDLVEHADAAMYYAKHHGKNQVVLWHEGIEMESEQDDKR